MATAGPQSNVGRFEISGKARPQRRSQSVPGRVRVSEAPRGRKPHDTFPPVLPFSTPYKSVFTTNLSNSPGVLDCLEHVNCSYLSNGVAPNLLQLKKHAQSLAVLIKELTVSTLPALVDSKEDGVEAFNANESFDWLNDLNRPYVSDQIHHLQPLTSLLNSVETDPSTGEVRNMCPLHEISNDNPLVSQHPYATHSNLIQHANEIIERLDHEYSAKGGFLSIFPTDMQKEDRKKASETALGQLIFWVQNLVLRIHHLERLYANSLDLLAKEAVVPTETLTALGTRGRRGREVVYPQDKFVLANAGEDLWDFLNATFEEKEKSDAAIDKMYRGQGTTGEALWEKRGGKEFAKGICHKDIVTRYYRLRDHPLKTIFIIPAYEEHPGVKVTREMEAQPTVVAVVKPTWPERASVLEGKHKGDMAELKRLRQESRFMKQDLELKATTEVMAKRERETLKQMNRELKRKADESEMYLKEPANASKAKNFKLVGKVSSMQQDTAKAKAVYDSRIKELEAAKKEAIEKANEMKMARDEQVELLKIRAEEAEKIIKRKQKEISDLDADVGRANLENNRKLKALWLKQITESQVLIEILNETNAREDLATTVIPDHVRRRAEAIATEKFHAVASTIPDVIPRTYSPPPSSDERDSSSDPNILSQAPAKPSWRQKRSKATGFPSQSGDREARSDAPSPSSRRVTSHPSTPVTGDSTKTFAASSAKRARISPDMIMGPTGSAFKRGLQSPSPYKRARTEEVSPRSILGGRRGSEPVHVSGGRGEEREGEVFIQEISSDSESSSHFEGTDNGEDEEERLYEQSIDK